MTPREELRAIAAEAELAVAHVEGMIARTDDLINRLTTMQTKAVGLWTRLAAVRTEATMQTEES